MLKAAVGKRQVKELAENFQPSSSRIIVTILPCLATSRLSRHRPGNPPTPLLAETLLWVTESSLAL
jgi:hypothetical protein